MPSATVQNGVKCAVHKWVTFPKQVCATSCSISSLYITLSAFASFCLISSNFVTAVSSFSRTCFAFPSALILSLPFHTWLTPGYFNHPHSFVVFWIATQCSRRLQWSEMLQAHSHRLNFGSGTEFRSEILMVVFIHLFSSRALNRLRYNRRNTRYVQFNTYLENLIKKFR